MSKQDKDAALFSRSGISNPLGRCTAEVKTSIPEDAADHIAGLAVLSGKTKSEYIRDVLIDHLYGRLNAVRISQGHRSVNGD